MGAATPVQSESTESDELGLRFIRLISRMTQSLSSASAAELSVSKPGIEVS